MANKIQIKQFEKNLQLLIARISQPAHNNELSELAYSFAVGKTLAQMSKRYVDPATKAIRAAFIETKLAKPCDTTELVVTSDVTIFGKVTNPRETFDKNEFIKQVAIKYNIPTIDLHAIAETSMKKSAAPVSLTFEFN